MITLDSLTQNTVLSIGKQLENNSTDFIFNAETWLNQFPDGIIALLIRRAEEEDFYVANTGINFVNKTVSWMITSYDTEIPGYNLAEFQLISDGAVRKSATFKIYVTTSLYPGQAPHETPAPQWVEDYLSEFTALHSGTVQAQEVASIASDRAEEARERAQEEADRAKDEADRAESAATGSIEQAEEAAERAAESAQQAQAQATIATNQANRANNYANYANNYANNASRSASSANTQANRAETYATQASSAASSAYQSASLAETAVTNATAQADRAKDEADRAKNEADRAKNEADRAETAADNCENKAPSIEETEGPVEIANFPDGADNFPVRVQVQIEPVQAGSGDPSPENVRPISGWDQITVTVSPTTQAADGNTKTIDLPQTVYGGTLTINKDGSGEIAVDRVYATIGNLSYDGTWTYTAAQSRFHTRIRSDMNVKTDYPVSTVPKLLSDRYKTVSFNSLTDGTENNVISCRTSGSKYLQIRDTRYNAETISNFTAYANQLYVLMETVTPTTIHLTPGQIKSLLGTNNVWSDAGLITVQYTADTKLYIEKYIASMGG